MEAIELEQLLDPLDRPIYGARAIGRVINKTERQVKYMASQGQIPVSHAGRSLYSTLRRLLAFVNGYPQPAEARIVPHGGREHREARI
jgi:hypothetical protein